MLFLLQSQARLCWTGTNGCQQEAVPDTRLPYNCAARARASLWAVTGGGYGCFLLRFYVCHSTAPARTELSLPPTCPSLLGSSVRESGARAVPNVQGIRARGDRLGSKGVPEHLRPGLWWPPRGVWRGDVAAYSTSTSDPGARSAGWAATRCLPFGGCWSPTGSGHRPFQAPVQRRDGAPGAEQRHWRVLERLDLRERKELTGQNLPVALGSDERSVLGKAAKTLWRARGRIRNEQP